MRFYLIFNEAERMLSFLHPHFSERWDHFTSLALIYALHYFRQNTTLEKARQQINLCSINTNFFPIRCLSFYIEFMSERNVAIIFSIKLSCC